MFQFPGFPAVTYEFSKRFMILHHEGFPIRKSTDNNAYLQLPVAYRS